MRFLVVLFLLVTMSGCSREPSHLCRETGKYVSNQQLIDLTIDRALEFKHLGSVITTRKQLYDKYPDCCIMIIRHHNYNQMWEYISTIQTGIVVSRDEPGLRPKNPEAPGEYFLLTNLMTKCGAFRKGGLTRQLITEDTVKSYRFRNEMNTREENQHAFDTTNN